jgi:hypothetical protein
MQAYRPSQSEAECCALINASTLAPAAPFSEIAPTDWLPLDLGIKHR